MTLLANIARRVAALICVAASLAATPAHAWGDYGHRTIAAIAMENVKPQTRARVMRILQASPELATPDCPIRTLEDAATWPDCIRGDRLRWGYTSSWHYQNISVCRPFDIREKCPNGTCVTGQVERNAALLANRTLSAEDRVEALAFLAHFVGDMHMPLHIGENDDLGGNRVKAMYGIAPGRNLHAIWDGALAERAISSAAPPLVRRYPEQLRRDEAVGTVEDWARESWTISRDFLYPEAFGELPCDKDEAQSVVWTNAAIEKALPIVESRIERAGLRLAWLLDEALG
jgi:hypothetical protein